MGFYVNFGQWDFYLLRKVVCYENEDSKKLRIVYNVSVREKRRSHDQIMNDLKKVVILKKFFLR